VIIKLWQILDKNQIFYSLCKTFSHYVTWLNPFSSEHGELVTLSTGAKAPVAKDLLEAYKMGEEAFQTFQQDHLQEDAPSTQLHEKMRKKKLQTFSDTRKKSRNQSRAEEMVLKADRRLFGQIVIIAESRKLHMRVSCPIHCGLYLGL